MVFQLEKIKKVNLKLKKYYNIPDEYDYIKNSIYKTYVVCDSYSNEILLKNHYRCDYNIINFNNQKFYNNQLRIMNSSKKDDAIELIDMKNSIPEKRNTSLNEIDQIVKTISELKDTTSSVGIITPFVNQSILINERLEKENIKNVICGTIHTFQGDERDAIILSTSLTNETSKKTYEWLSNNKELINVATSRAKEKLIILCNKNEVDRLSDSSKVDDFKELIDYAETNGKSKITQIISPSKALGLKTFSTSTEKEFMETLSHAISVVQNTYFIRKEVSIKSVFQKLKKDNQLFYTGIFDFVIFNKYASFEYPVLAIELDGKEHYTDEEVKRRDRMKEEICKNHELRILRVKMNIQEDIMI